VPLYDYGCRKCELAVEITLPMSEVSDHKEPCPECGGPTEQIIGLPGMIRVRDGKSPTRFGPIGSYKQTQTARDSGFKNEFETIFEGSGGPEHPGTGERMELMDDEGGVGPYMAFPSSKAADQRALRAAERAGMDDAKTRERNREQYLNNRLKAAGKRVKKWDVKRKGRKS